MAFRILLLLLLCSIISHAQQDERSLLLAKADTLIEEQKIDSSYAYIIKAEEIKSGIDIDFRKAMLDIFEENWDPEEALEKAHRNIDLYLEKGIPGADIVKYSGFVVENIIPHDKLNEKNLKLALRNLELLEANMDSFQLMHHLHNVGILKTKLGDYYGAEEDLQKAVKIGSEIDTRYPPLLGIMTHNHANAVYYQRDYIRSYEIVEKAADLMEEATIKDEDYLLSIYNELAQTSIGFGYFEKGDKYLKKVEERMRENGDTYNPDFLRKKSLHLAYNRMYYYAQTEQIEKATDHLKSTLEAFSNHKDDYTRLRLAAMNNSMGEMFVDDHPKKSLPYYLKAIEIFNKPEDTAYGLMFHFNIAKAYLNSGQYEKALEKFEYLLARAVPINDRRLPYFYFLESKVFLKKGEFEKGLVTLDNVLNALHVGDQEISLRDENVVEAYQPSTNLNDSYLISGIAEVIEQEIPLSQESMKAMNTLYLLAIKHFKAAYPKAQLSGKSELEYKKMLDGLLRTDLYLDQESIAFGEIIKFSENANSRNLWEQIKAKNKLIDSDLIKREAELRNKIVRLKTQDDHSEVELFDLELAIENLEEEKRSKFTSYYLYEDFDFDFTKFQNQLGDDEVAIKYEFLDSVLYAFVISKENGTIHMLDSLPDLSKKVVQFTAMLRDPSSDLEELKDIGTALYKDLIPEGITQNEWLINLDGVLNYLPFELLRNDDRYLLEDKVIRYATSFSILQQSSTKKVEKALIVAPSYDNYVLSDQELAVRGAAYNLEGALAEADAISEIIPSEKVKGEEANKEMFLKEASDYDLLHLSMHSFMNDEDPSLSSLVFHDDTVENQLYIEELYGMQLKAALAVLSACNTGVGTIKTGEGMVSVNNAFTYAGVPAIVSSLWSAPDQATKQLMTAFYEQLSEGKEKHISLRESKLAYLSSDINKAQKHPFFWAGFILHGDPQALEFGKSGFGPGLWISLGVVFFLLFFVINKTRTKQ